MKQINIKDIKIESFSIAPQGEGFDIAIVYKQILDDDTEIFRKREKIFDVDLSKGDMKCLNDILKSFYDKIKDSENIL